MGGDMRGAGYRDALAALDKLQTLRHARAETAVTAVNAVLGYIGAVRIMAAVTGDPEAVGDRRLIAALADLELGAQRLAAIPQRGGTGEARRAAWSDLLRLASRIRASLVMERESRRAGRPQLPPGRVRSSHLASEVK